MPVGKNGKTATPDTFLKTDRYNSSRISHQIPRSLQLNTGMGDSITSMIKGNVPIQMDNFNTDGTLSPKKSSIYLRDEIEIQKN